MLILPNQQSLSKNKRKWSGKLILPKHTQHTWNLNSLPNLRGQKKLTP